MMTNYFDSIDKSLMLALNGLHNSFFDNFMPIVSDRFTWIPLYVALLVLVIVRFGWTRKTLVITLMVGVAVGLTDLMCAELLRPMLMRPRPSNPDSGICAMIHTINGYRGGAFGMPSCHAGNSFALALMIGLLLRRRMLTVFMYAWAVLHVYSRIYLGVHYPGDLLAGLVIGSSVALVIYFLGRRFLQPHEAVPAKPVMVLIPVITGLAILAIITTAALLSTNATLLAHLFAAP